MTEFPTTDDRARAGCEPARVALQRLLDGDTDWDAPEAAAHRAGCADCREELGLARTFAVASVPVTFPTDLGGKVLVAAVKAGRRRRLARYAGLGMSLAASMAVAVYLLQPNTQTVSESRSVAIRPQLPEDAPQKPLGATVSEAREAIVALTRRAAAETADASADLIPNPKLGPMPDAASGLEPLADAQAGAARSIEPLRTSARRALNLFMKAADPASKPAVQ